MVREKVVRVAAFGAFVEIEPGVEGLCHTSEVATGKKRGSIAVGDEYSFRILRISPTDKKVGLSMKEVVQETAPEAPPTGPAEGLAASTEHQDDSVTAQET